MRRLRAIFATLATLAVALPAAAVAASHDTAGIAALASAPPGVVFEIASSRGGALEWAVPEVRRQIDVLRKRFPGLPVAVVTHGNEQFALTRDNRARYPAVHEGVREMTQSQDIDVHVCGTYASWRNLGPEDFPEYVNVAAAGPTTIKNYRELGYLLVVLEPPRSN